MRGVTVVDKINEHPALISTRTPHAGSDQGRRPRATGVDISTRTPHAGSDADALRHMLRALISTRTPHAGSD